MNETINQLKGIITAPGPTLGNLMERKRWLPALVLIMTMVFFFTILATPEILNRVGSSDSFSPGQLEALGGMTGFRLVMAGLWAMFITLITIFISASFIYLFFGIARAEGSYVHYFSLVVNASIVGKVLPLAISIISILFKLPLSGFSNLTALVPAQPNSLAFLILSQFDAFYLWYLVILAAGVAVFSRMNVRKCLLVVFEYFIFVSTVKVAFSFLFIKLLSR